MDKIKLDKKFTATVGTGTLRERIVPSVIELARELSVEVIVEAVENEEQVEYFRSRGVHLMQSWLYGRPLASEDFIRSLEGKGILHHPHRAISLISETCHQIDVRHLVCTRVS